MSNTSFYREELTGHRRRLADIRPRIDASTPSSYFVLINRAKKDQLLSDWAHNVDTANLALLSRMTAIANQHTLDDHRAVTEERERRHREQSDADRKREQKRIEEENARMIERLNAQKSNYGTSNWQSHAAAYEKHIKEVRLRQLLIADPINAKKKILEEKEKERAARKARKNQKLKPLNNGTSTSSVPISYERDETMMEEEKEAAEVADEEERRAGEEVSAFDEVDVDELLAADKAKSVGSVSLSEWMLPRNANHTPLHQDSHTIDSHLVLLTIDEVNRSTGRSDVPLGDDWSAFTTHPPTFLHSYLLRSYDLDSGLHSHLYLPVQAVAVLAKGLERRLERVIELLGYTEDGELYFKQSLMPKPAKAKEDKRAGRLYAARRAPADRKEEKRVQEEPKTAAAAEVKVVKRGEKKKNKVASKPVEEAKEQTSEPVVTEAEVEAADEQAEQPAVEQASSVAAPPKGAEDVEQAEAEPEQQQQPQQQQEEEEEENYDEDNTQSEQVEPQPQEEAAQPEPATAAPEPDQQPEQPVAEQTTEQPAEQSQTETVADSKPQEVEQQQQSIESEASEAVSEQTQPQPPVVEADQAEQTADKADTDDSAADESSEPQQQPAANDSKPEEEAKQAEETQQDDEYADDTQPELQSPVLDNEPASSATSPVPAYHKELPSPPAVDQPEQEQPEQQPATGTATPPEAASPTHGKEATAEEEKEATPLTLVAPTTPKPASPSVSGKAVAHQHRSVASPISGSRKTPSHQDSPRRHGVPTTH